MKLYILPATNFESLFGSPMERKQVDDVVIIAQTPDCSSFLVLSKTNYTALEPFVSYDGFNISL